jgi:glycerol-3-phosphate dehydrogenase subunit C
MTTTYDPKDAAYYDEADLRGELTRVYDLCHGCRLCFNLCPSFPSLFDAVDRHDGDVEALSTAEQDKVVDECYQCKLCYVKCPYVPPHEWALDFPRLLLRAQAVRRKQGGLDLTDQFLGRTDLLGKLSTVAAPVVNKATGTPNSLPRRLMEKTVGIAADRLLPPYARERFTTWFKRRNRPVVREPQRTVALFPTCLVEYQNPAIGKDTVKVFERNGVECELPAGQVCCGMPWLDGGDVDNFVKQGRKNVEVLARAVRQGKDVVVPQPTCAYVLKKEYPTYVGGPDAALVAEHTYDVAEYLWGLHKGQETSIDTEFPGDVPDEVAYHVACHLQAQNIGLKSRDLMKLTGTKVTLANHCSGIDGTWGYRAENYELARKVAQPLKRALEKSTAEVVTGDCHLANGAITQETGKLPLHPMQFLARAYGIPEEPG